MGSPELRKREQQIAKGRGLSGSRGRRSGMTASACVCVTKLCGTTGEGRTGETGVGSRKGFVLNFTQEAYPWKAVREGRQGRGVRMIDRSSSGLYEP